MEGYVLLISLLVVTGDGSDRIRRKTIFRPTILSSAITNGASIARAIRAAETASDDYIVSAELQIENFSKWPLINPQTYLVDGQISYPPTAVLAGQREAMVMHKTPFSVYGTYGTVSWELYGGKRVIVMWSSPFHFLFEKNQLALGFINVDLHHKSMADEMKGDHLHYTIGEYFHSANRIERCDQLFCVQGTMGTSHHPQVKIYVYPRNRTWLANNVQAYMDGHDISNVIG